MVTKHHHIVIYVGEDYLELTNEESINLRLNNYIFKPTDTQTNQAEYSFSFNVPSTPKNDKIFNYANNLSKQNKFSQRYSCTVYADEQPIFKGTLTLNSYNAKTKLYNCNLVSVKVNSLEEIFGNKTFSSVTYNVPYSGVPTINEVNSGDTDYYFPLVAYSVFEKAYKYKDDVAADYTSKFDIDEYNRWWHSSFMPHMKMTTILREVFHSQGYEVGR